MIRLDAAARFVPTPTLRAAYLPYAESRNPSAPPFVELGDGLELGIVASAAPGIAAAISSLLTRSLEAARDDRGGHLPVAVVQRVQREIISPHGVAHLWGATGNRFVLARAAAPGVHEIVATLLVAQRRQTVFFLTGRYNNLLHSTIEAEVDFAQPIAPGSPHRWFDLFAFPPIARFKPRGFHHIANFVVAPEQRGRGLSRRMLDALRTCYARDHLERHGAPIRHCQRLLCGRGFWQIGDPPWLARMERLGFALRWGAESFFIEHAHAPLPPIVDKTGAPIAHRDYTASFGLPDRYLDTPPPADATLHLLDRVPEVIRLARDPRAKLQYFQTIFEFV